MKMGRMRSDEREAVTNLILGVLGFLFVLWILGAIFGGRDPNVQLAETATRAVKMAENAREEAERTRKTSSALKIVAVVVGVTAPLAVAYLIYRLHWKSEVSAEEVVGVLKGEKTILSSESESKQLDTGLPLRLKGKCEGEEQEEHKGP